MLTDQAAGGGCLSPSIVIQNSVNQSINCYSRLGSVFSWFSAYIVVFLNGDDCLSDYFGFNFVQA